MERPFSKCINFYNKYIMHNNNIPLKGSLTDRISTDMSCSQYSKTKNTEPRFDPTAI